MTKLALLFTIGLVLFCVIFARKAARLPKGDRLAYWARSAIYLVSIAIVAWPLELARRDLGEPIYLASACGILFGGFALGLVIARILSPKRT